MKYNNLCSEVASVHNEVLQGCGSGPLLFINDVNQLGRNVSVPNLHFYWIHRLLNHSKKDFTEKSLFFLIAKWLYIHI